MSLCGCQWNWVTVFITSTIGGYVFVAACLFVCEKDYANTARPIFIKLTREVAHGQRNSLMHFGVYPGNLVTSAPA